MNFILLHEFETKSHREGVHGEGCNIHTLDFCRANSTAKGLTVKVHGEIHSPNAKTLFKMHHFEIRHARSNKDAKTNFLNIFQWILHFPGELFLTKSDREGPRSEGCKIPKLKRSTTKRNKSGFRTTKFAVQTPLEEGSG